MSQAGQNNNSGGGISSGACVSAYASMDTPNLTGSNQNATVIFDTELVDSTSSYNTSTGVFTAPATGNYHVDSYVTFYDPTHGIGSLKYGYIYVLTTQNTFRIADFDPGAAQDGAGMYSTGGSVIAPMDEGDTLSIIICLANTGVQTAGYKGVISVSNPPISNAITTFLSIRFVQ